jgi:hypothetical protein
MHRIVFFDSRFCPSTFASRAIVKGQAASHFGHFGEENNGAARRLVRSGWVERTSTTTAAALPTAVGWSEEFRIFSTKKPARAEKRLLSRQCSFARRRVRRG